VSDKKNPPISQRNALAPALIAAAVLFLAPVLITAGWGIVVLFVTAIFALIVGWFAVQARQWWWVPVFLAIAVVWNPVFPFGFDGLAWGIAQALAAVVFLVAGALVKTERA